MHVCRTKFLLKFVALSIRSDLNGFGSVVGNGTDVVVANGTDMVVTREYVCFGINVLH
jgi:hypothetical protein